MKQWKFVNIKDVIYQVNLGQKYVRYVKKSNRLRSIYYIMKRVLCLLIYINIYLFTLLTKTLKLILYIY